MMYTDETARHLGRKINETCPGLHVSWKPYQHYVIFAFAGNGHEDEDEQHDAGDVGDVGDAGDAGDVPEDAGMLVDNDCTSPLYFSLHELQLVRLEERPRHHHQGAVRMLYVGDIHTDRTQRQTYRPTSYQPPLLPAQVRSTPRLVCEVGEQRDGFGCFLLLCFCSSVCVGGVSSGGY